MSSAVTTVAPAPSPTPPPLPRFDFWQLAELDRHDLGLLLSRCNPQSMVLALAGGSDAIMQHVTRSLPPDLSRELERRVNHLSQVRLTDVAKAQQQLALVAAELMASGKLHYSNKA